MESSIGFVHKIGLIQFLLPPICTGILFAGLLMYGYMYIRYRQRIYLGITLLTILALMFVGSETMILSFGSWLHNRAVSVQFHRLEQISGVFFLSALPFFLSHLLVMNKRWHTINYIIAYTGLAFAVITTLIAFLSPDLFISLEHHKVTWLIYEADYGRGAEGLLYHIRDGLLGIYILYAIISIIIDILWHKNVRNLILPVIGLLFPFMGAINDTVFIYMGINIDFFPHEYFSRFTIGITVMMIFFMSTVTRRFIDSAKNLELIVKERTKELQVERNKLHERNIVMETEIALARKIQEKLIPEKNPAPYISFVYAPMEKVGGDFYDFIEFEDSKNIGIFLSDVSGHGVPAAFITSMIKTILLQSGSRLHDPAGLFQYMNQVLQSQTAGNFVTAFYCIYNPVDRSITYSNAGHNQPYIITRDGVKQLQGGRNTAIAMFPNDMQDRLNLRYENYTEILPVGSKLLLNTDGLEEAQPIDSDMFFQYAYMKKFFIKHSNIPCDMFLHKLMKELIVFRKSENFEDDICMICMDIS
ncbi:PP2C family protein-serine/threonine phosphatase [Spirochaetota bacterium]